jgi:hypothetical protein
MNFLKNKLKNSRGDQHFNDCLAIFIEKDFFRQDRDEDSISRSTRTQIQQSTFELALIFFHILIEEREKLALDQELNCCTHFKIM